MQLREFVVTGLFGKYDHVIEFPTSTEEDSEPSVVILHGPNGVGKTTLLRMLSGIMEKAFGPFRAVPFATAAVEFNTGQRLEVSRRDDYLAVTFDGSEVRLHPDRGGPWKDEDAEEVQAFRDRFDRATDALTFEYVSASRIQPQPEKVSDDIELIRQYKRSLASGEPVSIRRAALVRAGLEEQEDEPPVLARTVRRFIRDAQIDVPTYFRATEPDLFMRIISELTQPGSPQLRAPEIADSLLRVHELEATHARLGLGRDRWDFDKLMSMVVADESALDERALTVLGTYTEFLSARAAARELIAERLLTFERVMCEFMTDKQIRVDSKHGLTVTTSTGSHLQETQLSSGEYQLLYLMVAALTTRRRGTVIAIDEPELSMHIGWQRRLVPSLLKCASRAAPQLLLATHSPEIAAGYPDSLIELTPSDS